MIDPKIIIYLIFIVFPFGQLLRFQLPFFPASVRFHPLDLLILLFNLVVVFYLIKQKSKKLPAFSKEISIFLAIASISLLINSFKLPKSDLLVAFFYLARLYNYFWFYLSLNFLKSRNNINLLKYLFLSGFSVGIFSILQYVFWPDTRFLFFLGWDEHYFRAIGTFFDPGFNGLLLVLTFLLIFPKVFEKVKKRDILAFIFLIVSIGLTFSRATYLSLFAGVGTFLFKFKNRFSLSLIFSSLFLCLTFLVLIFILPKPGGEGVDLFRTVSVFARIESYQQVTKIIAKNPILGVGYNAYRFTQKKYGFLSAFDSETTNAGAGTDNSFLFIWATTGIFGFISFLWLISRIVKKALLSLPEESSLIVLCSFSAITVSSFFSNAFFYPWVFVWFIILLSEFTHLPE